MENQQLSGNPIWDSASIQPSASQDTTTGNPYWDTPKDVTNAQAEVGKKEDQGFCESFAERMTGSPNMGTTAAEAFQNYAKQGKVQADIQNAKPGDLIYFDNGQPTGHVGILVDTKGNFISADYDKISMNNLSTWKQKPLGFVTPQK